MAGYGEQAGGSFSSGYRNTSGKPGTNDIIKQVGTDVAVSTASGAITGFVVGSVVPGVGNFVGAAFGGAFGAVKGVISGIAGHKKSKARYYKKLAAKVQQQRENNSSYNQYLKLIRQTRISRAQTIANAAASGLDYSTAFYGATSGTGSQSVYSVQYLGEDRRLQQLYAKYMKKAGKYTAQAEDLQAGSDALESLVLNTVSLST